MACCPSLCHDMSKCKRVKRCVSLCASSRSDKGRMGVGGRALMVVVVPQENGCARCRGRSDAGAGDTHKEVSPRELPREAMVMPSTSL